MMDYLEAVKKAPAKYKPLGRKRLAEPDQIEPVEQDIILLENDLVAKSGGGVCLSTDGGKVGHSATRADEI